MPRGSPAAYSNAGVFPETHERIVLPDRNTTHAAPFVHCVAPAFGTAGELTPQIALNRQDETVSSVPFRYYDPPALSGISPTSGPALGGTRVELYGANFSSALAAVNSSNASDALLRTAPLIVCRFGAPMWPRRHGHLSVLTPTDSQTGPHAVGARPTHTLVPNEVYATVMSDGLAVCFSPPSVAGTRSCAERAFVSAASTISPHT